MKAPYSKRQENPPTTTVTISEQGRLYVPKPDKESLEIDGKETSIGIAVRIEDSDT